MHAPCQNEQQCATGSNRQNNNYDLFQNIVDATPDMDFMIIFSFAVHSSLYQTKICA